MNKHLQVVATYFDLVNSFSVDAEAYAAVLHPGVVQTEYPNGLYKTIQRRSFTEIIENLRIGREMLDNSQFDVQSNQLCADGNVIVEGKWQASTVSEAGSISRGQRLSAQLCLIFEFKDGKIFRQRRYPCFDTL
jgi:ketosteroid isomerase-like protein